MDCIRGIDSRIFRLVDWYVMLLLLLWCMPIPRGILLCATLPLTGDIYLPAGTGKLEVHMLLLFWKINTDCTQLSPM